MVVGTFRTHEELCAGARGKHRIAEVSGESTCKDSTERVRHGRMHARLHASLNVSSTESSHMVPLVQQ